MLGCVLWYDTRMVRPRPRLALEKFLCEPMPSVVGVVRWSLQNVSAVHWSIAIDVMLTPGVWGRAETTQNHIRMHGSNCRSFELWFKETAAYKWDRKRLLKGCTKTCARN
ncbi:hypothetical protein TNCV_3281111 [Trichonephila clavipes]|nr:hypothetical protein TNCV_3281111 [Trichonephila clavipes]